MLGKHKKELEKTLLVVFVIFVVTGGIVYSISDYFNRNKIDLKVKYYTDKEVYIKNVLPVADKLGKNLDINSVEDGVQGYVYFSIYNPNNRECKYDIYLTKKLLENKMIKENYIKVFLTDDKDKAFPDYKLNSVPVFKDLSFISDMPDSRLLYSGKIEGNKTKKFKLRMWLSDLYSINGDLEEFKCLVNVRMK